MTRPLAVFLPVASGQVGAIEALLADDPGRWLPEVRPAGPHIWRCALRLGPFRREVACEVGGVRSMNGAIWRDLSWWPVAQFGDRLPVHETLPSFQGELGLHTGQATLILDGSYDVPGGRVGEAVDALALGRAARSTGTRLLVDVCEAASTSRAPMPAP